MVQWLGLCAFTAKGPGFHSLAKNNSRDTERRNSLKRCWRSAEKSWEGCRARLGGQAGSREDCVTCLDPFL